MLMLAVLILQYLCLASIGVYLVRQIFIKKDPAPYPPGPQVLPLVGNLHDIPHDKSWLTFTDWGKNCTALVDYHPIEEIEAHRFLNTTVGLILNFNSTAAAVILCLCYGYEVKEDDNPLIDIAKCTLDQLLWYSITGEFMPNRILVAKVPEWFPGAGFKHIAHECHKNTKEMAAAPYKFVKDQVAAGIAPKSFASDLLKDHTLSLEENYIMKWSAVFLFSSGANTTVSAIYSFFLDMTLFPAPIVPPSPMSRHLFDQQCLMSVDHSTTQDDIYDGYYIPKGSLIIINVWSMLNDLQTHANPSEFNPEHFLAKDGKSLREILAWFIEDMN
ncbi:cytochrome P450 [Suillus hirtellus]|nr:cytochrome P450 [Suillus hirtellus]